MQRVHWDPEFARRVGQPDHVRLRPHARDVAHPPLHRLDGRRRVAVEARLRVPEVQLRRRHAVAARARRAQVPRRRRPARRSTSSSTAVNQRGEVTTPGHATILLPSRGHGAVRLPDPPGGARDLSERARRDLRGVRAPMTDASRTEVDGLAIELDRRRAAARARPAGEAQRDRGRDDRGPRRRRRRGRHRRARARDRPLGARATTSAAAPTSSPATRTARRDRAPAASSAGCPPRRTG